MIGRNLLVLGADNSSLRKSAEIEAEYQLGRQLHGTDAAVAPDRHFYAAVRRAAFDALSCPPRAHLEKKTWVPNAVCTFMMSITP